MKQKMKAVLAILMLLTLVSSVHASAPQSESVKETALKFADAHAALTEDIAESLWEYAEVGLNEYKSYVKVRDVLVDAGFAVHQAAGNPTALVASWGSVRQYWASEDIDALPDVATVVAIT